MSEHIKLKSIEDAKSWGKILGNRNRVRLLVELSKSPLSKGKIADILGVTPSTVNGYVTDLINAGVVTEYTTPKDGWKLLHIVRLKQDGIVITFKDIEVTRGWQDE